MFVAPPEPSGATKEQIKKARKEFLKETLYVTNPHHKKRRPPHENRS
jgi:hypothetical protein